jgi:arylformamidase
VKQNRPLHRALYVLALLPLLGCQAMRAAPPTPPSHPQDAAPCDRSVAAARDVPYREVEGVDPSLLALDVYGPRQPEGCVPAPVVVWVHGGAWMLGDKANKIDDKIALFTGQGYVFVTLNYRLSPSPPALDDEERVMHPTHADDVAAAIAFMKESSGTFGGAPERMALLGHSAGGHLVALVATDERLLAGHGLTRAAVACVAALDTEGYDIPRRLVGEQPGSQAYQIHVNAFGSEPEGWRDASPIHHVSASAPPLLVLSRGSVERRALQADFAAALVAAGAEASVVEVSGLTHAGINDAVGAAGDEVVTPALTAFFRDCLRGGGL